MFEAFERLYNARAGLREYFDKAKDQLKEVKSDPAKYLGSPPTDEDLSNLQTYLGTIESKIESEEAEHKIQEDGAKNNIQMFKSIIAKT